MSNVKIVEYPAPRPMYRYEDAFAWTPEQQKAYQKIGENMAKYLDEHDPVNHPRHYTWLPNGVEVIDITENLNFCLGNAVKYILRSGHKESAVQDLEKAVWYLKREIGRLSLEAQA